MGETIAKVSLLPTCDLRCSKCGVFQNAKFVAMRRGCVSCGADPKFVKRARAQAKIT